MNVASTITEKEEDIAVRHFRQYLRINTAHPNPDYEKCVKFLFDLADGLNLERSIYECIPGKPFVIMTLRGHDESLPSLMLYSHTDVVPTPNEESWKFAPFAGVKDTDGKIYGRGTQDMKSVGIQYVEAIRRLFQNGQRNFRRTIHIIWGPDEEIGGEDGMEKFVRSEVFEKLNVAFVLDEGLPTKEESYKVYYAERCAWWIVISCKGQAGHGLQLIENTASEKLQRVINSFMGFREEQKRLLELNSNLTLSNVISVNLTKIEGGVQLNVLPTEIKVWFDLRIPPMHNFEELENQISKWCTDAGSDVTYSFIKHSRINAMTPITDDDSWWRAFSSVFKHLNYPISVDIFPGSTDSRFVRQKGIRSINFSPINKLPVLLHAPNEYITEECFLNGVTIYEKLIEKLANLLE
uniref:N-acyl-aliphatic-L-amino acid amidohydrolase n=1 Tax=Elaeophora elaphi TaxID=1147741 RepID=A0A158Q8T0_9BILA